MVLWLTQQKRAQPVHSLSSQRWKKLSILRVHVRTLCKTHSFLTLSPWQSCRAAPLLDVRSVLSSTDHHHHHYFPHYHYHHLHLWGRWWALWSASAAAPRHKPRWWCHNSPPGPWRTVCTRQPWQVIIITITVIITIIIITWSASCQTSCQREQRTPPWTSRYSWSPHSQSWQQVGAVWR